MRLRANEHPAAEARIHPCQHHRRFRSVGRRRRLGMQREAEPPLVRGSAWRPAAHRRHGATRHHRAALDGFPLPLFFISAGCWPSSSRRSQPQLASAAPLAPTSELLLLVCCNSDAVREADRGLRCCLYIWRHARQVAMSSLRRRMCNSSPGHGARSGKALEE